MKELRRGKKALERKSRLIALGKGTFFPKIMFKKKKGIVFIK